MMIKKYPTVLLVLTMVLSSCTINRYYKTKDIKKSYNKYQKQMDKAVADISKYQTYQDMVVKRVNTFGLATDVKNKVKSDINKSKKIYKQVIDLRTEFRSKYSKLDLRGKKIKSTEKRYPKLMSFRDYSEKHVKRFENKLNDYKKYAESFVGTLKDHKITFIKTKDVKKQFDKSSKHFDSNFSKVDKSIKKFKNKLNVSRHKKKKAVMGKLREIDGIMGSMSKLKGEVAVIVKDFDDKYRNVKEIIFWPESKVAIDLEKIKQKIKVLQSKVNQFNKKSKEINELLK